MKEYQIRRATRVSPGIEDLEAAGELNILLDGRSVYHELWDNDVVWNQFTKINAWNDYLAVLQYWIAESFYNYKYNHDPKTGLTQEKLEVIWDQCDSIIEVRSVEDDQSICRIYRVIFDSKLGFVPHLLAKSRIDESFEVISLDILEEDV